ncbi:MAG: porin [Gammaproteobacteria bacterium]|nr:porin [Gammaproteobacteria bacterium]
MKTHNGYASVLAMTIGGMLAASPAHAFEFNIYGVGHLSADSVDDGSSTDEGVASNSSRLGFKGNHDLGGGMKALFQAEAGIDLTGQGGNDGNGGSPDDGDVFTNARDSYVGLAGDWGTLLAGKLGGLNQWVYDYNLFADQVGDLGNIWGGSGLPGRVTSTLHYRTPDFSGLSVGFSYIPDEDNIAAAPNITPAASAPLPSDPSPPNVNSDDIWLVKADYASGGLKLGGAYTNIDLRANDWEVWAITGSYDFGRFTVGGGWQNESDMGGAAGNDRDSYTLGASAKVGTSGTVKAQVAHSDGDASNSDATQWAVGYDHALNKYVTVYGAYAATDNDSAAAFSANNYGKGDAVTPALGDDPGAFSIGLVVTFDAQVWPR